MVARVRWTLFLPFQCLVVTSRRREFAQSSGTCSSRRMRRWLLALAFTPMALLAGGGRAAFASGGGCPKPCEATVAPVEVIPPLSACARVQLEGDTCACTATLQIVNQCASEMQATDFQFDGVAYPDGSSDRELPPGTGAYVTTKLLEIGRRDRILTVQQDGEVHTITVHTEVTSFVSTSACSIAAVGLCTAPPLVAVFFPLVLALRRRRVRR